MNSYWNPKYLIQIIGVYQVLSKYTNSLLHKPFLVGSELGGPSPDESQIRFFHPLVPLSDIVPYLQYSCLLLDIKFMATRLSSLKKELFSHFFFILSIL